MFPRNSKLNENFGENILVFFIYVIWIFGSSLSDILTKSPNILKIIRQSGNVESGAVQKCVNVVDLEKCCEIKTYVQKSASIQPEEKSSEVWPTCLLQIICHWVG